MTDDQLAEAGAKLATQCRVADVQENHLAMVVAHLVRHKNVEATQKLLNALPNSPFADRSHQTPRQLKNLKEQLLPPLQRYTWEEAAKVIGWAKRLSKAGAQ